MSELYYCSQESLLQKEPLPATASFFDQLLLIEHPAPFPQKALPESQLPPVFKKQLLSLNQELPNLRVLLIRQADREDASLKLFYYQRKPDLRYREWSGNDYSEIKDLKDFIAPPGAASESSMPFRILVCTNGKKDKCCSKYGLPIFNALATYLQKDQLWQCSHTGGDRFAPNLIVLPQFLHYGRLRLSEVTSFVDSIKASEIYLPAFRGRNEVKDKMIQSAEYYFRQELKVRSLEAHISFEPVLEPPTASGMEAEVMVKYLKDSFKISLRRKKSVSAFKLSCQAREEKTFQYWEMHSLEKVSA